MASGTTPARGKLLDYEQFIDHQLGLTQSQIKKTDVLTAVAIAAGDYLQFEVISAATIEDATLVLALERT